MLARVGFEEESMTDWAPIHEKVMAAFEVGWDQPSPHAWDAFLDESMHFVQPMLRHGVGRELGWEESARTLKLVPDLRADVLAWSGHEDTLFIHIRFTGTLGGRPLTWEAVDLLHLDSDGQAVFRESFFDSFPVALALVRRPRAWLRWWRSGVGPLFGRRRVLRPVVTTPLGASS
jgi:hypothetical protein